MRKVASVVAGAALAVGLLSSPSSASIGSCGAPGATSGGQAAGVPGTGEVYAGNSGTNKGWVGEKSDRGYIEVTGDMSTGITIHGATSDGAVSGKGNINPTAATPVSVCLSGGGQTVRA
ncbi:MAG TPA: hypothetical protein VM840_07435 [Actinomycetota bacterium]|nr:hypothetical protein [Actinomycetota bacterium]